MTGGGGAMQHLVPSIPSSRAATASFRPGARTQSLPTTLATASDDDVQGAGLCDVDDDETSISSGSTSYHLPSPPHHGGHRRS
eukprot:COSAG05_NODE_322_length_11414_cov_47.115510_9_plen_83_part_00